MNLLNFKEEIKNINVVGLTGGIATGKSTVSDLFKKNGAIIIDADKIAHVVVEKGKPAWQKIVDNFGQKILFDNGQINRKALGEIIFNDDKKKDELNKIVHPFILEEMCQKIKELKKNNNDKLIILDIPLLIEMNLHKSISEILLVYIPQELQIKRLMKRDGISNKDALAKISSQMPIEEKRKFATIIIDNSQKIEGSKKEVEKIYKELKINMTISKSKSVLND